MEPNQVEIGNRKRSFGEATNGEKKPKPEGMEYRSVFEDSMVSQQVRVASSTSCDFTAILPVHLVAEIFSRLPARDRIRSERVCRLWQSILRNHSWTNFRTLSYWTLRGDSEGNLVGSDAPLMTAELLSVASRCGKYLRLLDLEAFVPVLDDLNYVQFAPHCVNLRTLHLTFGDLTNEGLSTIGAYCRFLEEFTFFGCLRGNPENGILTLLANCRQLKDMQILRTNGTSPEELESVFQGIPSFTMLPDTITTLCFGNIHVNAELLETITERCPKLKCLVLCNNSPSVAFSSSKVFADGSSLTRLRLDLNSYAMTYIGERIGTLKNLEELVLRAALISPSGLNDIANGCPKLRCLDLGRSVCPRDGLGALSRLRLLTCLAIEDLQYYQYHPTNPDFRVGIDDEMLNRVVDSGSLRFLSLNFCSRITNEGVSNALDRNRKLVCLNLKGCSMLTMELLQLFYEFAKERLKNDLKCFEWRSINEDIGDSVVVERYAHRRKTGCNDLGFPYVNFCSFIYSATESACNNENDGNTENPFPELHIWFQPSRIGGGRFEHRYGRVKSLHPSIRLYSDELTPYMRLSSPYLRLRSLPHYA